MRHHFRYKLNVSTSLTGNITETKILYRFVLAGKTVSVPFGNSARYDFVVDDNGTLKRVQCKTAHVANGAIIFNAYSVHGHGAGKTKGYENDIDLFAVYCPYYDQVYLVPVADTKPSKVYLRMLPPKTRKRSKYLKAEDYIMK